MRTSQILEEAKQADALREGGNEVVMEVQDEEMFEIPEVRWERDYLVCVDGQDLKSSKGSDFQRELREHVVVKV